jgi:hypothetical protein
MARAAISMTQGSEEVARHPVAVLTEPQHHRPTIAGAAFAPDVAGGRQSVDGVGDRGRGEVESVGQFAHDRGERAKVGGVQALARGEAVPDPLRLPPHVTHEGGQRAQQAGPVEFFHASSAPDR